MTFGDLGVLCQLLFGAWFGAHARAPCLRALRLAPVLAEVYVVSAGPGCAGRCAEMHWLQRAIGWRVPRGAGDGEELCLAYVHRPHCAFRKARFLQCNE